MKRKSIIAILNSTFRKYFLILLFCMGGILLQAQPICNAHFSHYALASNTDSIHFYDNNTVITANAIYSWSFGDGSHGSSQYPWHYYSGSGNYYVCLTVSDSTAAGTCTDTWCDSVHVVGPTTPPPPICNAHFSYYALTTNTDSIHFYTSSTASIPGATYSWSFGDGHGATSQFPWHLYSSNGTYYVCLTVAISNSGGTCTDTWCDSVHVGTSIGPIVHVHPNPANPFTTLTLQNIFDPATIRIYDITGNLLYRRANLSDGEFDISTVNFKDGLYYYLVEDGSQTFSRGKLIIIH